MKTVYLLFVYDQYYPLGGFNDYEGEYETVKDALKHAITVKAERYHIVEFPSLNMVDSGGSGV